MKTIDTHINQSIRILDDFTISSQSRRHIEEELESLLNYKNNHPNDDHDPSSLDLFCDANPNALECRKYDI